MGGEPAAGLAPLESMDPDVMADHQAEDHYSFVHKCVKSGPGAIRYDGQTGYGNSTQMNTKLMTSQLLSRRSGSWTAHHLR